jgi:dTDP-4-dehydrorhamnose reductase
MNILVTGANGQLGRSLRRESAASRHKFIFTDIAELDITNLKEIEEMVEKEDIGAIVNCAAYTNVEKAEDDAEKAHLLNAVAPCFLADVMKRRNGLLLHISTDYVFGGNAGNTPKTETEPENPTGVYGLTKLQGEKGIIDFDMNYVVIRTAWLYSEYGNNFVKTMINLMSQRDSIKVVYDQVGTPTYAGDLAKAILTILSHDISYIRENKGMYHFSNEGVASWYDFAVEIKNNANSACEVKPCLSSEFPSKVCRPPFSVLNKSKIKEIFNVTIPYWKDSLSKCMAQLL